MAVTDRRSRSPYEGARVEELEEPLLPRWFVLLAIALIPVAIGTAVAAFVVFGPDEVPVGERRPPPSADGSLTTDVGAFNVGTSRAVPLETSCGLVDGLMVGGSQADRERIAVAAEVLCDITVPETAARGLVRLGQAGGEVRFAQFEATGVDSTVDVSSDPPRILLNARFAREGTDPLWIAPLLAYDATMLELDPSLAVSALAARQAEARICAALFVDERPSRACDDAAELLDVVSPIRALEAAGFR